MRVLGLSCGRKMGNSETLMKEALMGAEEMGAEVEIVRLLDLNIKPCIACGACAGMAREGKEPRCVQKDDSPFILDRIKACDGFILSAPVYALTPTGFISILRDKISVQNDVPFMMEYKKMLGDKARFDPRLFKKRVGGLISVGGAETHNWTSMGIPVLYTFVFPLDIQIVDHMQVTRAAALGHVVLQEKAMKKAHTLGQNIVISYEKPSDEITFLGEQGLCPVCHCNLIEPGKKYQVECPVCAAGGTLEIKDNKLTMTVDEKSMKECRLTHEGQIFHLYEILRVAQEAMQEEEEVGKKMEKYKSYKSYSRPSDEK